MARLSSVPGFTTARALVLGRFVDQVASVGLLPVAAQGAALAINESALGVASHMGGGSVP